MQEPTSSSTDVLKAGNRVVAGGIAAIVLILLGAAVFLFLNLPCLLYTSSMPSCHPKI